MKKYLLRKVKSICEFLSAWFKLTKAQNGKKLKLSTNTLL